MILQDDYDSQVVNNVFGTSDNVRIRRVRPNNAKNHLSKLKKNSSNPQSSENDKAPPKVNLFYGRPPVTMEQIEKSYAHAVKTETKKNSETAEINQLAKMLNSLREDHNQLKKSLPTEIATSVSKQMDSKIKQVTNEFDKKVQESEKRVSNQFDDFLKAFRQEATEERAEKKKADNEFRENLLRAISETTNKKYSTPRGVSPSARGGDK